MFFPNYQKYLKAKQTIQNLKPQYVSEQEFIDAMVANGETLEKAQLQAKIAKGLGGAVLIGDKLLGIKE